MKIEPKVRNAKFVEHIEKHLRQIEINDKLPKGYLEVVCKICGKTIDKIAETE